MCGVFVYSLSYCHRVSSHNSSGYDTCQSIGPIISREKILEKIRRMVYRSGVFMDTGNTRLKCPTWLPCQRCVLGVRQKRETCLLRVAYIYIYIYYHCQFYRSVSTSSTRFHRGKSCYRCYNRPSPYPKVTSKQQTLPPSVFIDSCRGNDTLYFPLSSPSIRRIFLQSERNLLNRS